MMECLLCACMWTVSIRYILTNSKGMLYFPKYEYNRIERMMMTIAVCVSAAHLYPVQSRPGSTRHQKCDACSSERVVHVTTC